MKTIDELLAKIARAGNFSHLSIHCEWKTGLFTASFRDIDGSGIMTETDKSPVVAIQKVLMRSKVHRPAPADKPKKRLLLNEDIL